MERLFLVGSLVLGALVAPAVAHAYEDQLTVGLGVGYAHAAGLPQDHGGVLDAALGLGLGVEWTLRLRGGYALHPEEPRLHAGHARAELLYVIDVLEVVPYFGLGAGGLLLATSDDAQLSLTAGPVFGVDYLLSRELALTFDVRGDVRLAALDGHPFYFALTGGALLFFDL